MWHSAFCSGMVEQGVRTRQNATRAVTFPSPTPTIATCVKIVTPRDKTRMGYLSQRTPKHCWLVQHSQHYHRWHCQQHHSLSVTRVDTGTMCSKVVHTCGWWIRTLTTMSRGTIPTWVARRHSTVTRPTLYTTASLVWVALRFRYHIVKLTSLTRYIRKITKGTPIMGGTLTGTPPTNRGTALVDTTPRSPPTPPSTQPAVAYHSQPHTMVR